MSLEQEKSRRKGIARRTREMAKAAKIVGPAVRNIAVYSKDPEKKLELAKLLAANVQNPGSFGHFITELRFTDERENTRPVVKDGAVKESLIRWSSETKNLMNGWPLSELAQMMGVAVTDSRLRKRVRAMSDACRKLGLAVEPFRGSFKVLTIPEAAVKQEQQRANIEGQIKSRARKSKPLELGGYAPNGQQNVQLKWWDLPQFKRLEEGDE